jgi:hypothetical protein
MVLHENMDQKDSWKEFPELMPALMPVAGYEADESPPYFSFGDDDEDDDDLDDEDGFEEEEDFEDEDDDFEDEDDDFEDEDDDFEYEDDADYDDFDD